jgi:hypothetical protein
LHKKLKDTIKLLEGIGESNITFFVC